MNKYNQDFNIIKNHFLIENIQIKVYYKINCILLLYLQNVTNKEGKRNKLFNIHIYKTCFKTRRLDISIVKC